VGCGVLASAVGMDKIYAKIIFEKAGIPRRIICISQEKKFTGMLRVWLTNRGEIFISCIVKPSNAGSSVGVSKAHDKNELKEALIYAPGMIEKY